MITVYSKMVQAYPRNSDWCEYPDGHLLVRIFYSGDYRDRKPDFRPWCIFSVCGRDDTLMEINEYVSGDREANELINKWLDIYHDMPKHFSMDWLYDRGFVRF
jgi:hypothetical protein